MVKAEAIGAWAFILGVLIAVWGGALTLILPADISWGYIPLVLVVLGLIVGFLNIADKEIHHFLIAGIALVIAGIPQWSNKLEAALTGQASILLPLVAVVSNVLANIAWFAAPAVLVVSLKAFYTLSKGAAGK